MRRHQSTVRLIVLFAGMLAIAVGVYIFVFTEIKNRNTAIATLQDEVNRVIQSDAQLEVARRVLETTAGDRLSLAGSLVEKGSIADFIEELGYLGDDANVSFVISSVATPKKDTESELELAVGASGSWNNVMYFLSFIEALPRGVTIKNVSLNLRDAIGTKKNTANIWDSSVVFSVALKQ